MRAGDVDSDQVPFDRLSRDAALVNQLISSLSPISQSWIAPSREVRGSPSEPGSNDRRSPFERTAELPDSARTV
jgi:hypothetical protein